MLRDRLYDWLFPVDESPESSPEDVIVYKDGYYHWGQYRCYRLDRLKRKINLCRISDAKRQD